MRTCLALLAAGLAACSDFSLPDGEAQILGVTVTPAIAAKGAEVEVAVAGSRPFSSPPQVRLLGQLLPAAPGPGADGRAAFVYTATGSEPEGVELAVEVSAGGSSRTATLRFDFTPPQLLEATSTPSSVRPGETLQLALKMSEPLVAPPLVKLAGAEVACAASAAEPTEYRCTTTPTAASTPGWQQAWMLFADPAGNRTALEAVPLGALFDLEQPLQVAAPHILPERAGRGTQVLVSFQATRVLSAPPVVTLGGRQATPLAGPDLLGGYIFGYTVLGTELGPPPQDGALAVVARLGDVEAPLGSVRLDLRAPGLVEPEEPAELRHVGRGEPFTLDFLADEELAGFAATIQGLPMECEALPEPTAFRCRYAPLGSEREGPQSVVVWLADRFGNSERVLSDARVSFDFTCEVRPERVFVEGRWGQPWRFLAEPGAFDPGATVSVRRIGATAPLLSVTAEEDGSIAPQDLPGDEVPVVEVSARGAVASLVCPTLRAQTRFFATPAEVPASGLRPGLWPLLIGTAEPDLRDAPDAAVEDAPAGLALFDGTPWTLSAPKPATAPDWVKVPSTGPYPDDAVSAPLTYLPGAGAARFDDFGNYDGSLLSWDGAKWSRQVTGSILEPVGRTLYASCFDRVLGKLLHSGGLTSGGIATGELLLAQPWSGDGNSIGWSDPPPSVGPTARLRHAMVWDASRRRSLLFGGFTSQPDTTVFGDTWSWDAGGWARLATEVAPSARSAHGMAYDPARRRVVLFGGSTNADTFEPAADTWEWAASSWVQRAASGPPARGFAPLAAHLLRGSSLVFGGRGTDGLLDDTWEWNGSTWSPLVTLHRPPPLYLHGLTYDERRGRLVVYGGSTTTTGSAAWNQDVWELTESGYVPAAMLRLVSYDPGLIPRAVTVRARARCLAPGLSPAAECVALKVWDNRTRAWKQLASIDGEQGQALSELTGTISGAELPDLLAGQALRVLLVAPPSSVKRETALEIDSVEARFDW